VTDDRIDTGTAALTYEPPSIEIAGVTYKLRRLGILDTLRLAKIVAAGVAGLGREVGSLDTLDPQVLGMLILAGAPFAERQVLEFLGSVIGVEPKDMADPNKFPMGSEVQIVEALVTHEDVRAFFDRLQAAMRAPGMRSLFQSKSTSSKADTAGQTERSSPSPTPATSSASGSQRAGKGKRSERD
jgi:hypothetical protein